MTKRDATRRSFMRTAGAALTAPVAVAVASAPRVLASGRPDDTASRLARLEDEQAIRALNQAHMRQVRARPSGTGDDDMIAIAADRSTAAARVHCMLEIEEPIGPDAPLVRMAREQGGGVIRRIEHGVFEHAYVRRDGAWTLQQSTFAPA